MDLEITLCVNGETYQLPVDPRTTLLDALHERLGLTGSKKGCDQGACGACTVLVDGKRILSCLTLAATCEDRAVLTIEGLSKDEQTPITRRTISACCMRSSSIGWMRSTAKGKHSGRTHVRKTRGASRSSPAISPCSRSLAINAASLVRTEPTLGESQVVHHA